MFATRIPTHFNDGTEIPADLICEIEFETWARFGGLTFGAPTVGAWVDPATGKVYRETAREMEVAIDPGRIEEARQFVQHLRKKLKQEAMIFIVKPFDVEFL